MKPPSVCLEFEDLFKSEYDNELCNPELDDNDWPNQGASYVRDFVGEFVEKAAQDTQRKHSSIDADLADASWNEIIGVEKSKKPTQPATGTLAERLGIVRTEIRIIDCGAGPESWSYGYNAAGEEVASKLIPKEINAYA